MSHMMLILRNIHHCSYYGLQNMEWNRRVALEKELDKDRSSTLKNVRLCWDYSGYFVLYPSPVGVKVGVLDVH